MSRNVDLHEAQRGQQHSFFSPDRAALHNDNYRLRTGDNYLLKPTHTCQENPGSTEIYSINPMGKSNCRQWVFLIVVGAPGQAGEGGR